MEQAEKESNLPIFEKKIEAQLGVPLDELLSCWYIKSFYSLFFSFGSLNDRKATIPLLKGVDECLSLPSLDYQTMDAGYDYDPIYEQVHRMGNQSVIAYNKKNEGEPIGFDKHFAPTCLREHSCRYDSFDAKYETLK